jgi:hypothetical protein
MQASYLSPTRFRRGGFGFDVSSTSDAELRNILVRATSVVNAFCHVGYLPQPHDFRGGTVVGEQHEWPVPPPLMLRPGSRRVHLNHRPIRGLISFSIHFTNNYQITMNANNDFYVNAQLGYVEVVASSAIVTGIYPVGINFGLHTPIAEVSYTYGWQFEVAGDVLEAESPTVYTGSHGNWDPDGVVEVAVDGTPVAAGDYTVNYDDGSVTFTDDAEPDPDTVVTADYTYLLPDAISQATGLVATYLLGQNRLAGRGMLGLQSIKVAEVAITAMQPTVTRNGVTIPSDAAMLLGEFQIGSAA